MIEGKTYKIVLLTILLVIILSFFGLYKCPLNYIFGIPCITCGITRAIFSLFTLNFKKSFYYHALWPLVFIGFIIYTLLSLKIINIKEKNIKKLIIIYLFIFILYFIIRHFTNSPIVKVNFKESLIYRIYNYFKIIL
ncbi:MAG: DUF2752 domain-containing protein [bacterium]|nr:DUF2752 domain-containing protein [bacterium]